MAVEVKLLDSGFVRDTKHAIDFSRNGVPCRWRVIAIDLEVLHDRVNVNQMLQQRRVPLRGWCDDSWQKDDVVRRHAHRGAEAFILLQSSGHRRGARR